MKPYFYIYKDFASRSASSRRFSISLPPTIISCLASYQQKIFIDCINFALIITLHVSLAYVPFSGWVTDSSQMLIKPVSVISTIMDRMIPVTSGLKLIFNIIIAKLL